MSNTWQIDCGPDGSILFGPQSTRYPFAVAPELGDPERTDQDSSLPGVDGNLFGVDTVGGQTISFGLTAVGETDEEAATLYRALHNVWRADSIRSTPGAVATLTAPSGRSTFGRPRRFTPTFFPNGAGAVGATCDFATQDDRWYGDADYLQVPLAISQSGGLVEREYSAGGMSLTPSADYPGFFDTTGLEPAPNGSGMFLPGELPETSPGSGLYATSSRVLLRSGLKEPLVARGYTTSANTFHVDGDMPTWPVVTVQGPIVNPTVEVTGRFRFTANTSLRYDETLVIDTRPGRRSVLRNGSQIAALTRTSTMLSDSALPPGNYTLILSGSSSSGAPTARVDWRAAYSTP